MTQDQIEYAKLLETVRANQASEGLKQREVAEQERSHRATEGHNTLVLGETSRHNQMVEMLEQSKLDETKRHSLATESETGRHNLVSEQQQDAQREQQRDLEQQKIDEAKRHNLKQEGHATAQLVEDAAYHAGQIVLGTKKENIHRDELEERKRHNVVMELKDTTPKVNVSMPEVSVQASPEIKVTGKDAKAYETAKPQPGKEPFSADRQGKVVFSEQGQFYALDRALGRDVVQQWIPFEGWKTLAPNKAAQIKRKAGWR